jgi:hypothetical protein
VISGERERSGTAGKGRSPGETGGRRCAGVPAPGTRTAHPGRRFPPRHFCLTGGPNVAGPAAVRSNGFKVFA